MDLVVNGAKRVVEVDPTTPLLWVLREHLGLTGTKYGCGVAQCGSCTVHIDGAPVRSCVMPVSAAEGKKITTIEGLGNPDGLHWYGGDTTSAGTANRQEFPVDQESIAQFIAGDAQVSTTNVWAVEVHADNIFAYELRRPNRHFRVEFDLTRPIVTSCGSGVTASVLALALARLGRFDVAVYDGSWTEWGGNPDNSVIAGL